jgi:hypothetical protein
MAASTATVCGVAVKQRNGNQHGAMVDGASTYTFAPSGRQPRLIIGMSLCETS